MIIKKSIFDSASQTSFGRLISLNSSEMKSVSKDEFAKIIAFQEKIAKESDKEFITFEERVISKETNYLNRHLYLQPFLDKVKAEREKYKAFDLSCYQHVIESSEQVFVKYHSSLGYVFSDFFCGAKRVGDNCYEYAVKGLFHFNSNSPYFKQPGFVNGMQPYDQRSYLDAIRSDLSAYGVGMRILADWDPKTYTPTEGKTLCYGVFGRDHHFYRLDNKYGYWTHKPGSTPVTCFDNNGNLIVNPATCAKLTDIYNKEIGFFEIDLP